MDGKRKNHDWTSDVLKKKKELYILDLRGIPCPSTILYTIRALYEVPSDKLLEIIIDNQTTLAEIISIIKEYKYRIKSLKNEGLIYKITVRKDSSCKPRKRRLA